MRFTLALAVAVTAWETSDRVRILEQGPDRHSGQACREPHRCRCRAVSCCMPKPGTLVVVSAACSIQPRVASTAGGGWLVQAVDAVAELGGPPVRMAAFAVAV